MEIVLLIDKVEEGFTINSIRELSKRCNKLYLFTKSRVNLEALNSNIQLLEFPLQNLGAKDNVKALKETVIDFIRKPNLTYLKQFRYNLSLFRNVVNRAAHICKVVPNVDNIIFLSFWMDDNATVLAYLKDKNLINKAFALAHGRDLYEWRQPKTGLLPFKVYQLKHLDKVFSISRAGAEYLRERYPAYRDKVDVIYLGSYDCGVLHDQNNVYTVVSCARVRNVKRIHLIAQALSEAQFPIKWIHLGEYKMNKNDPTYQVYNEAMQAANRNKFLEIDLKGELTNKQIEEFYKTQPVDLFISVSESEGLPVSMMEAQSFGIPILSTDVGGCNEIVNDQTGYLLNKDVSKDVLLEAVYNIYKQGQITQKDRESIKRFWNNKFNIVKNFDSLTKQINQN